MKRSSDRVIGKSGEREETLTGYTGSYQGTSFSRAVTEKNVWALAPVFLRNAIRIIRATLSEIFDESAYDRFLLRTHRLRSVASYRDFMRERDMAMAKKPRCC